MSSRRFPNPYLMILAIQFIGENGPSMKSALFEWLIQFVDKEKSGKKKSLVGSTDDVLFNLKVLQLAKEEKEIVTLTTHVNNPHIHLYSGQQVYFASTQQDKKGVLDMIQTNSLFFSPEIREIAAFIVKRGREAEKNTIGQHFDGKHVFGHKFNSFTIDTSLTQLERLEIIRKTTKGDGNAPGIVYTIKHFHPLIFAQLLVEEYTKLRKDDDMVHLPKFRDYFSLKYNVNYGEFDAQFSFLKATLIPSLVIPGSYEKFSLNMAVAREVKLDE